jgi:hypothetical protein
VAFVVFGSIPSLHAYEEAEPAVAAAVDGTFLVVWRHATAQFEPQIVGQRYDDTAAPLGTQFVIADTGSAGPYPAVARLADGRFLVVWGGVRGRVVDATGGVTGEEIVFSEGGEQPDVAMNANGRGLVTWAALDGSYKGIFARRIRSNGQPRGTEFLVNTYTTGQQYHARAASSLPLRYVVVWASSGDRDGDHHAVFGQQLNRLGNKLGTEFLVNGTTMGFQGTPDVARGRDREFVVVWAGSFGGVGPNGFYGADSQGIRGQRFGPRAHKRGSEFVASTFDYGPHSNPSIDSDDAGNFVVAWTQGGQYEYNFPDGPSCGYVIGHGFPASFRCQDGAGLGNFCQRFDADGERIGPEQPLSGAGPDTLQPAAAMVPPGRFVVVWRDAGCLTAENYNCRYNVGDSEAIVPSIIDFAVD